MGYLILFVFTVLLAAGSAAFQVMLLRDRAYWVGPSTWFLSLWIPQLLLLAAPIFVYREELTVEHGLYIALCLTTFSLGTCFVSLLPGHRSTNSSGVQLRDGLPVALYVVLAGLGLFGQAAQFVDGHLSGTLSLGQRFSEEFAETLRMEHLGGRLPGPFQGIETLFAHLSFLSITTYAVIGVGGGRTLQRIFRWLVWFNVIAVTINALLILGGRMNLVFMLLAYLMGISVRGGVGAKGAGLVITQRHVRLAGAALLAAGALWYFAVDFVAKRTSRAVPEYTMYRTHRAQLTPLVRPLVVSSDTVGYAFLTASYLTTPIPTLLFYLELREDRLPGPFYGQYNFPFIARQLTRFDYSRDPYAWFRARIELFDPLYRAHFGSNVWSTLIRDLIADFGKWGVPVFLFLLGAFAQGVFRAARTTRRRETMICSALINVSLVFSALLSVYFIDMYFKAIATAFLLWMLAVFQDSTRLRPDTNDVSKLTESRS